MLTGHRGQARRGRGTGSAGPGTPRTARTVRRGVAHAGLASLLACAVLLAAGSGMSSRADTIRNAQQPVLAALGIPAAWRLSTGSGVTIGVLDTGVDGTVPDLTGSVIAGPDYAAGANPPGYQPPRLHGTYIASLIAGHGDGPGRSDGVIGVAPSAHILAVRVLLDDSEPGFAVFNENARYLDTIAEGINYAVSHGVGVINMSLGGPVPTKDEIVAIGNAISHGVVVVAAAGNDGAGGRRYTPYSYPASVTGVISVAAVTASGQRASFSDHNASVLVSAPGVNVVGAGPGGGYLEGDGTSQASALVAGVAALIRAKYPGLPPVIVTRAIIESTTHRPPGGYNTGIGFGEVNAAAALRAAAALAHPTSAAAANRGLNPTASVGGAAARAPIKIVHRDNALILAAGAAGAAACLGLITALAVLVLLIRRIGLDRARLVLAAGHAGGGTGPGHAAHAVAGRVGAGGPGSASTSPMPGWQGGSTGAAASGGPGQAAGGGSAAGAGAHGGTADGGTAGAADGTDTPAGEPPTPP